VTNAYSMSSDTSSTSQEGRGRCTQGISGKERGHEWTGLSLVLSNQSFDKEVALLQQP